MALNETPEGDAPDVLPDEPEQYKPEVPKQVRTVAYFAGLGAAALVLLAVGIAPVWFDPQMSIKIVATGGVVSSVLGFIASGLGVVYRPTAQGGS